MASTARAVTSMHLIVTQHTDRLLPFDAALNGVAAADHCPVPVTTWFCSTLEPDWSPFSKLALSSVAQTCSRHHRKVSSGCHSGSSAGDCPIFGVTAWHLQLVVVGVRRPSKVIAKALSAGFHRMVRRDRPRPVGSRDRVTR